MAEYDITKSSTTSLDDVKMYSVGSVSLDYASDGKETEWTFSYAQEYIGYYKKVPQVKQSIDGLATWVAGKGYTLEGDNKARDKVLLDMISGWGEDTIDSILENMIIMKKTVGDAFAEIIRNKNGTIINIKPISPERMKIIVSPNGRIKNYEYYSPSGWKPISKEDIFHVSERRLGDEIHGTSILEAVKWAINAKEEAMRTYRKIMKRAQSLGVLYVDTDDTNQLTAIARQYKYAIENVDVLILPMKTAELQDSKVTVQDFISWISYLENFIYQALGVPKIILGGSSEYTEASSKVGYLTFEQVYAAEQRKLEQDMERQLGIRIKFNRPVSLKEDMNESEAKNTGQVGFQPNEMQTGVGRTE